MIHITDSSDIRIAEFISHRDHSLNSRNLFIAETEKIFLQHRAHNRPFHKILSTEAFAIKYSLHGENIFVADKKILESVAGFKIHFDVLFLAEIPPDTSVDKLSNKILVLNGLSSPENVGSIVRSCAAFKIESLIADEKTCSPFLRRCIRVSMGNVFALKIHQSNNLREVLNILKKLGFKIISSANIVKAISLKHFTFPEKYVLIIGSEGHGVDQDIINQSDTVLKIDIDSQVAHLNASNAASIFLSHMSSI